MKNLILMMLFSKIIILTPAPITLSDKWVEVVPKEPLRAITSGAGIFIDVTSIVGVELENDSLRNTIPPGSIIAKLIDKQGRELKMTNGDAYSTSKDTTELILLSETTMPIKNDFIKLIIKSKKNIESIKITWKNCKL